MNWFKYIYWLFDIRLWIAWLTAAFLSWSAEDWITLNYGLDYSDWHLRFIRSALPWILSILFALLLYAIWEGLKIFYKRFFSKP
ncbi:MAG: hypothetical protein P4N59_17825 [Negativicutes bacterium]|nr:hypothetical protein [Negativicutes bacterium]